MTEPMDWKSRIVELLLVKQAIDDLDTEAVWEYRLPRVAATAPQLDAVEASLGEPLDPGYRRFLEHADGWPAFWHTVDLFGSEELLGAARSVQADEMLSHVADSVLDAAGFRREDLLPIAATPFDLDLFVMTRSSSSSPGEVVWLAGTEIDRFPSFDEFYLSMVDYSRRDLQEIREENA